eukprot:g23483.t1
MPLCLFLICSKLPTHSSPDLAAVPKEKIQLPLAELLPTTAQSFVTWRVQNPNAKFKASCGFPLVSHQLSNHFLEDFRVKLGGDGGQVEASAWKVRSAEAGEARLAIAPESKEDKQTKKKGVQLGPGYYSLNFDVMEKRQPAFAVPKQDARANFISKDKDGLSRSTTTPIGSRTADPADEAPAKNVLTV